MEYLKERQPTGKQQEITYFIGTQFILEVKRLQLPYIFLKRGFITAQDKESGYIPDILIVDRNQLINEPLWEQYSTLAQGTSIPLVVEVVSSHWRDDYGYKMADYETLGIAEYWIIDYLGIGGKQFIGDPKQPTITVC